MARSCGIQDYLVFRVKVVGDSAYGVERCLIFTQLLQSKEFYLAGLKQRLSHEEFEEVVAYAEDSETLDDVLGELAYHLPNFNDVPRKAADICWPESATRMFANGIWERLSVKRTGVFARDARLKDDQLWFALTDSSRV
jgi:hypothetical protein